MYLESGFQKPFKKTPPANTAYTYVHTCTRTCKRVNRCTQAHSAHVYTYTHVYTCMHVNMYTQHLCIHIAHMYTHMYTHMRCCQIICPFHKIPYFVSQRKKYIWGRTQSMHRWSVILNRDKPRAAVRLVCSERPHAWCCSWHTTDGQCTFTGWTEGSGPAAAGDRWV